MNKNFILLNSYPQNENIKDNTINILIDEFREYIPSSPISYLDPYGHNNKWSMVLLIYPIKYNYLISPYEFTYYKAALV